MMSRSDGNRATLRLIALVAILSILAAACGAGTTGGGNDVAADLVDDDTSGDQSTETTAPDAGDIPKTLADFFGYGEENRDPAADEARYREQEMEVQQSIAECMAAEGFEYTPYVQDQDFAYYGPGEDLTEEEWKAKYGYGYFTMMLEETAAFEEGGFDQQYNPEDDPNWVYQESLSDSERQAYEIALYGNWENFEQVAPEVDEEGNEIWVEPDFAEIGGCQNLAYEDIYGGFGPDPEQEEIWQQLEPAYDDLWSRIESDPRIVEANEEWAACMADAGYSFTTQQDIWMYLDELGQDLWSGQEDFYQQIEAQAQALPEDEREAFYEESYANVGPWGPDVDSEQIQALADEEMAIAAADTECGGDMTDLRTEVQEEYEAQFILENFELLQKQKAMQDELGY